MAAFISASLGLAGGSVLLLLLSLYFPLAAAIGLHGLLQFWGGVMRVGFSWRALRIRPLVPYFLGLGLGAGIASLALLELPDTALQLATGLCLMVFCFHRIDEGPRPEGPSQKWIFTAGLLGGAFGPMIGVVGPITAPFFLKSGLLGEPLAVTRAFAHSAVHVTKIGVFWPTVADVATSKALLVGGLVVSTTAGTWLGSLWLRRIKPREFIFLSKLLLFATGVGFVALALHELF
jgi:uncharacterized membrane protein YfcA